MHFGRGYRPSRSLGLDGLVASLEQLDVSRRHRDLRPPHRRDVAPWGQYPPHLRVEERRILYSQKPNEGQHAQPRRHPPIEARPIHHGQEAELQQALSRFRRHLFDQVSGHALPGLFPELHGADEPVFEIRISSLDQECRVQVAHGASSVACDQNGQSGERTQRARGQQGQTYRAGQRYDQVESSHHRQPADQDQQPRPQIRPQVRTPVLGLDGAYAFDQDVVVSHGSGSSLITFLSKPCTTSQITNDTNRRISRIRIIRAIRTFMQFVIGGK